MSDDSEKERRREQDEQEKRLAAEHDRDSKARERHLKELNKEADSRLRGDQAMERILDGAESRVQGGGQLRSRICKQGLEDLKDLKWQGLGRDVHDFLTARQHGWDRAGNAEGFGNADRMP